VAQDRWKRLDLPLWVAVAVMVAVGWLVIRSVEARTVSFADSQGGLRLRYPAGWFPVPGSTSALEVQDPLSGAAVPTRLIVVREPRVPDRTLAQVSTETVLARSQRLAMYRVISEQSARIGGKDALLVEYAFVEDPHEAVLAARRLPVVVRGLDAVFFADGVTYHVDLRAAATIFDHERRAFDRILGEIQF
jgi:hypothetical protein